MDVDIILSRPHKYIEQDLNIIDSSFVNSDSSFVELVELVKAIDVNEKFPPVSFDTLPPAKRKYRQHQFVNSIEKSLFGAFNVKGNTKLFPNITPVSHSPVECDFFIPKISDSRRNSWPILKSSLQFEENIQTEFEQNERLFLIKTQVQRLKRLRYQKEKDQSRLELERRQALDCLKSLATTEEEYEQAKEENREMYNSTFNGEFDFHIVGIRKEGKSKVFRIKHRQKKSPLIKLAAHEIDFKLDSCLREPFLQSNYLKHSTENPEPSKLFISISLKNIGDKFSDSVEMECKIENTSTFLIISLFYKWNLDKYFSLTCFKDIYKRFLCSNPRIKPSFLFPKINSFIKNTSFSKEMAIEMLFDACITLYISGKMDVKTMKSILEELNALEALQPDSYSGFLCDAIQRLVSFQEISISKFRKFFPNIDLLAEHLDLLKIGIFLLKIKDKPIDYSKTIETCLNNNCDSFYASVTRRKFTNDYENLEVRIHSIKAIYSEMVFIDEKLDEVVYGIKWTNVCLMRFVELISKDLFPLMDSLSVKALPRDLNLCFRLYSVLYSFTLRFKLGHVWPLTTWFKPYGLFWICTVERSIQLTIYTDYDKKEKQNPKKNLETFKWYRNGFENLLSFDWADQSIKTFFAFQYLEMICSQVEHILDSLLVKLQSRQKSRWKFLNTRREKYLVVDQELCHILNHHEFLEAYCVQLLLDSISVLNETGSQETLQKIEDVRLLKQSFKHRVKQINWDSTSWIMAELFQHDLHKYMERIINEKIPKPMNLMKESILVEQIYKTQQPVSLLLDDLLLFLFFNLQLVSDNCYTVTYDRIVKAVWNLILVEIEAVLQVDICSSRLPNEKRVSNTLMLVFVVKAFFTKGVTFSLETDAYSALLKKLQQQ